MEALGTGAQAPCQGGLGAAGSPTQRQPLALGNPVDPAGSGLRPPALPSLILGARLGNQGQRNTHWGQTEIPDCRVPGTLALSALQASPAPPGALGFPRSEPALWPLIPRGPRVKRMCTDPPSGTFQRRARRLQSPTASAPPIRRGPGPLPLSTQPTQDPWARCGPRAQAEAPRASSAGDPQEAGRALPAPCPGRRGCPLTCSMSSHSSRPTKMSSRGSRWRVPLLLTRNHEVTLILALMRPVWPWGWEVSSEKGSLAWAPGPGHPKGPAGPGLWASSTLTVPPLWLLSETLGSRPAPPGPCLSSTAPLPG